MADFARVLSVIGTDEDGNEKTLEVWVNLDHVVAVGNRRVTMAVGDSVDTITLSASSWDDMLCYLHDHDVMRKEGV